MTIPAARVPWWSGCSRTARCAVLPTTPSGWNMRPCGTVVEPLISEQWFVKMDDLARPAIEAARDGSLDSCRPFPRVYLNWMENIHDWCISRQLWWAIDSVWYCQIAAS